MRIALFAATLVLAPAAALALAVISPGDAARIMHDRHEGMEAIGKANKAASRQLQGSAPDIAVMRQSSGIIWGMARKASGWFPAGTGPNVAKTRAKPEIWQDPKDFAAKLHNFQVAASAFNSAAAGGDVNTMKARFADLGGTCKACHDKYRAPEENH